MLQDQHYLQEILVTLARAVTYCWDQFPEASEGAIYISKYKWNKTTGCQSESWSLKRQEMLGTLTGRALSHLEGNSPDTMLWRHIFAYHILCKLCIPFRSIWWLANACGGWLFNWEIFLISIIFYFYVTILSSDLHFYVRQKKSTADQFSTSYSKLKIALAFST